MSSSGFQQARSYECLATRKGRPPPDAGLSCRPGASADQIAHVWRLSHGAEQVARIAGVNIPTNKRVVIALQYIHGIGAKKAEEICEKVHIPPQRRVFELTDA